MPLGSCHSAMPSMVTATWWAERMPGTSGSSTGSCMAQLHRVGRGVRGSHSRLAGIDDEALAEKWAEHPVSQPGDGRVLLDVPDEQPVVGARDRVIVVLRADGALQP